jgi:hypothetical protein
VPRKIRVEKIDFTNPISEEEQKKLNNFLNTKLQIKEDGVPQKDKPKIESYFRDKDESLIRKEEAIYKAMCDGYTQREVGEYLLLSHVAISKIVKIYKQKVKLYEKLRDKGIFWSYSKSASYEEIGSSILIEYLLKYGDFDDIKLGFALFSKRYIKNTWEEKLKSDKSFIKTNLMLARVFFDMDVDSSYFKEIKNARFEKLKMLAS